MLLGAVERVNEQQKRSLFEKIRPDICFSSDFIVGFPGETDADFESTMDLIQEIGFGV